MERPPPTVCSLGRAFLDRPGDLGQRFGPRFHALGAFAVEADGHAVGLLLAAAQDEHGMDLGFFGAQDLAVDLVGAEVAVGAHALGAQVVEQSLRVVDQGGVVANGEDAHLLRARAGSCR